ncbi:aminomethyltransferase [bacterium BMS3Abin05]|nr:aminomethyltransferase [bacterium BMS3Abin05]GBE27417.1 aminomethyltransferase [bacterium BMS3Bbin03]HDL78045.1 glycine cleavage system aminomethyltransferase GcvT [Bacteroidota bacterium]HDZ12643.1 glycine cleavage system aminomethyltransferase GcvT [Bacteroidota bacterium]
MEPKKTALFDVHQKLAKKIVEFGGYLMPVQYSSIIQEHKRVRSTVGMFDVSHMGEFIFKGQNALDFLNEMTINDVSKLVDYQAQYSAMCYDHGGIVDDLLVYRFPDYFMMVVNASNTEKDWDWLSEHRRDGVEMENVSDSITLLAVQGKKSSAALQKLTALDLSLIKFYHFAEAKLTDVPMTISHTGYTGEPGFELYFDQKYSLKVWDAVMDAGREFDIEPIGLGARDTLRLEMKYCLYGNDIDETTNPLEAGLGWITKLRKGDFVGRGTLLRVKEEGVRRKLIGFKMNERAFPRHGYKIFKGGGEIGRVTSGTVSPMLNTGIGMGYVPAAFSAVGTSIEIGIRGELKRAAVCETPFYHPEA